MYDLDTSKETSIFIFMVTSRLFCPVVMQPQLSGIDWSTSHLASFLSRHIYRESNAEQYAEQ